ncbi:MAG: DNA mismatch repair endonuclease MutL [Armatimonadota bacterium]|nr:DNA mismatch repair endonuclease MutL [Armatimonadota bacterium]
MQSEVNENTRIVVLDEHTANRIAAGEVVERPASVVKELVENSLDAGATQVTISIEQGGKELIKVTDNGIGMTREDAILSLQRHATSKIRCAADLEAIRTLGFRGEALPSIASVSLLEMITKHESQPAGVRLEVEAGTIVNLESVGAPQGTTIAVRKLFFNTPARLKFLKSAQTEFGHIAECIGWFAMAWPAVGFRLLHGGREVFYSPATGQRINAVVAVMGKDIAKQLVEVSYETSGVKVEGFVSNPSLTRINRRDQIFFVNGRPIRSKIIAHALDYAYRGLLPSGRNPVAILFLEIPPELVDVNVHPAKSEVKFSNEQEVHTAVHRAVNAALMSGAAAPTISENAGRFTGSVSVSGKKADDTEKLFTPWLKDADQQHTQETDLSAFQEALRRRREEALSSISAADEGIWQKGAGVPVEESPVPEADFVVPRTVALTGIRVIGQARNTYIVAECDDGLLVIDQHVAHERVLYDRLLKSDTERGAVVQRLVTPMTISLSARESAIVRQRLDQLRQAGFELEEFGRDTFIVRGAPPQLKPSEAEMILRDIITELVELSVERHLLVRPDQVLITTACKMAIKAGEKLDEREMKRLVEDLLKCENPFVCPHGRPIIVSLSNWELDRKFKRT